MRDLHTLLLETEVREGKMVCGNCRHEYKIKEGTANFLLPSHLGEFFPSKLLILLQVYGLACKDVILLFLAVKPIYAQLLTLIYCSLRENAQSLHVRKTSADGTLKHV